MRTTLSQLAAALDECGQSTMAAQARVAAAGTDAELRAFLTSNELWGGAGSIADQGGMKEGKRTDKTRKVESVLIRLGTEQLTDGAANVRTAGWVNTFQQWANSGI
jgi:hypothetical protein